MTIELPAARPADRSEHPAVVDVYVEAFASDLAAAGALLAQQLGDRAPMALGAIASTGPYEPETPHHLCVYVAVRPSAQGRGLGRAVMAPVLAAADAAGEPAHVVSTNPRNVPFYERLGFSTISVVEPGPGIPPLRPMWREPRS